MYTPIMIANTIVRNHPGRFDIQQIAKLVQIIQGWGLEGGKSIVCESPVAWEYGPMHESLYVACRHSGLMTARQKLDAPIVPPLGTMAPLVPSSIAKVLHGTKSTERFQGCVGSCMANPSAMMC
jgi:hypothetical protein